MDNSAKGFVQSIIPIDKPDLFIYFKPLYLKTKKFLSPVMCLVIWELIVKMGIINPFFCPAPTSIAKELYGLVFTNELWINLYDSLFRAVCGYFLAALFGVGVGLIVVWSKFMEDLIDPLIELVRPVSTFAVIPIFFIWFGIGDVSKVLIIAKACFFPIVLNTIAGIKGVDPKLIQAARSLGAKGFALWTKVLIPSALPMISTGLRVATSMSVTTLVGVEMLSADSGIGFMVIDAQRVFATEKMFAGILVLSALGFSFDRLARLMQNRVLSWHKGI
ncbi:MAG: ABC transporter permease [Desulfobacterium sp.]|jgi:ABC-type nitrate/sulfonate/bicarbonate transport system permease component|nr:ABC transporter permease [Desulfobacterium sp.]